LPGNVDGPLSTCPGRAGWTWYTGSAAWLNRVSIEHLIGARADWDGLRIDPCPCPELGEVSAVRQWRGREIHIRFDAGAFHPEHDCVLTVNGSVLDDNLLREDSLEAGASVDVQVEWKPRGENSATVHVRNRERSQA